MIVINDPSEPTRRKSNSDSSDFITCSSTINFLESEEADTSFGKLSETLTSNNDKSNILALPPPFTDDDELSCFNQLQHSTFLSILEFMMGSPLLES
ncbi:unnamed protein product [Ambrosiozyma monospora]|uniref:Unnamed protein product n=2 Tax=Ambrosiozyma monospora TaxID=43982 RepID=A0ACB5TND6_AMBMO|nr:unnamed protein product [Ambrosiozyma monospora]GMF06303.1 unnamed protein product [Ambrosiozyma monospora]